jgi:DNA-directed RNA polymerase subunit H (RpoH/RPB5)
LKKYFEDDSHILIIFKEKINNLNIKNLKEQNNVTIEIFMLKELQYNISKHVLVPKHEIVNSVDEVNKILDIYQLKKNQLPIILRTDPMARYLDVKSGEVVMVSRNSPSAGEAIVYRYCV